MRIFPTLLLTLLVAAPLSAQTARLQVIHNAPDPGAAVVDVYLNDGLLLDDLAFREASPFIDAPAGTPIEVDIAPGNSTSAADAIATFNYNLDSGETYQLVASGVLDPTMFAANPNGESIAFTLLVNGTAQEASTDASLVQFNVVHGSPDAPTVDVQARGVGTLVDNATYTDITGYIGVPPAEYLLDVTTEDGNTVVASFVAPLADAAGGALTVLASGFLDPSMNQNGPAFGLLAVFPDGATLLLPSVTARVQVIHNSPDPGASVVDIYLNDAILLDDFAFRTASPYIDAPAAEMIEIAVAPGTSTSSADAIATFEYDLAVGEAYQLIASGVLDPTLFAPNPDGVSTAFTLIVNDRAVEASDRPSRFVANGVHGSPDAPTVDIVIEDEGIIANDVEYTGIRGNRAYPPAEYIVNVTTADNSVTVASYLAPLADAGGSAVTALASGFLDPSMNQNGPAFGVLAVFPDGATLLLPPATNTGREAVASSVTDGAFSLRGLAPNPVAGTATVTFDLPAAASVRVEVYDLLGRQVFATPTTVRAPGAAQSVRIEASDLASGTYVYRVTAEAEGETFVETGRMTVAR